MIENQEESYWEFISSRKRYPVGNGMVVKTSREASRRELREIVERIEEAFDLILMNFDKIPEPEYY